VHDDNVCGAGERLEEFVENAAQDPPEGAEAARSVAAGIESRPDGHVHSTPQWDRDPWGGARVRRRAVVTAGDAGRDDTEGSRRGARPPRGPGMRHLTI
jgi:hypothetical protein